MSFSKFTKNELDNISFFNIKNSEEYHTLNNLLFLSKKIGLNDRDVLLESLKVACEKKDAYKTSNDYYHLLFSVALDKSRSKDIIKKSYPTGSGDRVIYLYDKEYDVKKWSDIVRVIYNTYYESKDANSFDTIVDSISKKMIEDKEELFNFKKWLKYYNEGNDQKYSSNRDLHMKKISSFYLPLTVDTYSSESNPYQSGVDLEDSFRKSVDEAKDSFEMKLSYKDWKKKFNTAWRRIDKILKESEDYIDPDKYEQISEIMHRLDVQIGKIRFKSTASDISFVASDSLKKVGFNEGANILKKFAQEVAAPPEDAPAPEMQPPGQAAQPAPTQTMPQGDQPARTPEDLSEERRVRTRQNEAVGEEVLKNIAPSPGPHPNEYDKLIPQNISIDDASSKLEQIAAMLSDRRVIRYLAEFDIMLDKLSVASMFPELAEAQSKLIDSYSYALVRVTKMLGMLSNNKAIFDRGPIQPSPAFSNSPKNQAVNEAEINELPEELPEEMPQEIQQEMPQEPQQ